MRELNLVRMKSSLPWARAAWVRVYRARDPRLGREVAIKVVPESFASDPNRLRRFEQEARAVGALNHPNILSVHDTGVQNGTHYIVTELLDGATLREKLSTGPLPPRRATEYAMQIALMGDNHTSRATTIRIPDQRQ